MKCVYRVSQTGGAQVVEIDWKNRKREEENRDQ